MSCGCRQSLLNRPPVRQTVSQSAPANAPFFCSQSKRHLAFWRIYNTCCSPVQTLLNRITPFAIIWTIPQIIVYAVNRCIFRSQTHVRKEVFKNRPALAYGNSSASIIQIRSVIGIFASVAHGKPRTPSRRIFHTVPSIFFPLFSNSFFMQTPATLNTSSFIFTQNTFPCYGFFNAAITAHKPLSAVFRYYSQSAKFLFSHGGYMGFNGVKCK